MNWMVLILLSGSISYKAASPQTHTHSHICRDNTTTVSCHGKNEGREAGAASELCQPQNHSPSYLSWRDILGVGVIGRPFEAANLEVSHVLVLDVVCERVSCDTEIHFSTFPFFMWQTGKATQECCAAATSLIPPLIYLFDVYPCTYY